MSDKPLQQLVNRLQEKEDRGVLYIRNCCSINELSLRKIHNFGPLPNDRVFENVVKYYRACKQNFIATTKQPDNCIMLRGRTIVIAKNFISSNGSKFIAGNKFLDKRDIFQYPMTSSIIHEFLARILSIEIECWSFDELYCKCVQLTASFPTSEIDFIVFPLLR